MVAENVIASLKFVYFLHQKLIGGGQFKIFILQNKFYTLHLYHDLGPKGLILIRLIVLFYKKIYYTSTLII